MSKSRRSLAGLLSSMVALVAVVVTIQRDINLRLETPLFMLSMTITVPATEAGPAVAGPGPAVRQVKPANPSKSVKPARSAGRRGS